MPFYKMIVPTVDTIRYEYLIRHLLLNKHQVLLVGAVGTGKTTVAENVLKKLDSIIYNLLTVHMSAQVNQGFSVVFQQLFFPLLDYIKNVTRYIRNEFRKTCKKNICSN